MHLQVLMKENSEHLLKYLSQNQSKPLLLLISVLLQVQAL